MYMYLYSESV